MSQPFPDPRTLLARHRLAAKKSWGQNFRVSDRIYRAIVDATVREEADWVVELGAGLGTLTMRLAERVPEGRVLAVERDRDLVAVLEAELGHLDNVEVVPANALTYDLRQVARWRGEPVAVCGNLPYHLASQILFRVLEQRDAVFRAVFMIQREMADRLVAAPGTRAYGALGVIVSAYADVASVIRVQPTAFVPRPRVDSTVVALVPLASPRIDAVDPRHFAHVVHAAFGQRRKTLRNALRARFPDAEVDRALAGAGIDGGRRGETLTLEEFALLAKNLPRARAA
jgi:16S rRNA (adenine1518-N6/adenine1519-N6)-dimethyltransferase